MAFETKKLPLFGFLLVLGVSLTLQFAPVVLSLNNTVLDAQLRFLRNTFPRRTEPDIAIVGIDEDTFRTFREPLALWHPHLGKFLEALAAARPTMVGLDVVLPDKSYAFLSPGYDRPLLAGLLKLRRSAPVFLAQTLDENGKLRPLFAPIVSMAGGREALGLALVRRDDDAVVRRFVAAVRMGGETLPTLAAGMAEGLGKGPREGIINYAVGELFNYISLHQVLDWHAAGETEQLQKIFAGKIVLLGAVLPFADRHVVPVPLAAWEPGNRRVPGVLIQAQALRSLLHGGLIQPPSVLPVILLTMAVTLFWWLGHRPLWSVPLFVVTLGLLWFWSVWLLSKGVAWPFSGAAIAGSLALIGRMALEGLLVLREKRRLRASFGRYVSPNVMREILAGGIRPGVGGDRRRVCVLFSDIRSFTSRSESQPPEAIITLLNRYFNEMTAAVHSNGGTIDKFIGDGLMAFFGAPNSRDNPARDGFNTAREMLQRLETLNTSLQEQGIEPIRIGVGLQIGEVVVGHVGSSQRHEYTAIGDTVNTASRLEGLTKSLGYPVVCSADVAAELDPDAALADLGARPVKGRAPVPVFGWRPEKRP